MKTTTWRVMGGMSLCVWMMGVVASPGGVKVGDSYEAVLARLGQPEGYIKTDTMSWLYYDRGTVKLEEGRVVEAELVSAERAAERRLREREAWERQRIRQAELQEQRLREGWALKQARRSDPRFLSMPGSDQADFWRDFQTRYPGVPVHEEYAQALERARNEHERALREREQEQRIADLEERLRRAEDRTMARSYSGASRSYYHAPDIIYVAHPPRYILPSRTVTLVSGIPVSHQRQRPIAMSHADRVFGSMPVMSSPGFHGSYRSSGHGNSLRISF